MQQSPRKAYARQPEPHLDARREAPARPASGMVAELVPRRAVERRAAARQRYTRARAALPGTVASQWPNPASSKTSWRRTGRPCGTCWRICLARPRRPGFHARARPPPSCSRSRNRCSTCCAAKSANDANCLADDLDRDAACSTSSASTRSNASSAPAKNHRPPAAGTARTLHAGRQAVGRHPGAAADRHARQRPHPDRHGKPAGADRRLRRRDRHHRHHRRADGRHAGRPASDQDDFRGAADGRRLHHQRHPAADRPDHRPSRPRAQRHLEGDHGGCVRRWRCGASATGSIVDRAQPRSRGGA